LAFLQTSEETPFLTVTGGEKKKPDVRKNGFTWEGEREGTGQKGKTGEKSYSVLTCPNKRTKAWEPEKKANKGGGMKEERKRGRRDGKKVARTKTNETWGTITCRKKGPDRVTNAGGKETQRP